MDFDLNQWLLDVETEEVKQDMHYDLQKLPQWALDNEEGEN